MALDFGLLQPANISGQLQAGQESAMRNQLAQQQLASSKQQMETGRLQQEQTRMQMEQAKRERESLAKMQQAFIANGKSPDMEANFNEMLKSGIPHFVDIAVKGLQALSRQKQVAAILGGEAAPGTAPAQGMAPMLDSQGNLLKPVTAEDRAAQEQRYTQMAMPAMAGQPLNIVSRHEGVPQPAPAGSEDRLGDFISQIETKQNAPMPMPAVTGRPITPEMAAVPATNMLAPPPAAPASVNTLAAPAPYKPVMPQAPSANADIENTYRKIDQLHAIGEHALAKSLEERVKNKLPPTAVQEYKFAQTPEGGGFKGTFEQFKILHAPRTTVNVPVNVSTEKKFGEQFASKLADTDINKLTTAEKAPQLAESANRIIGLVNQGNVFTGPAAEVKMNIARALNVAGASNDEKIANTEALIAATGQSTLDAIKGAGLGTGQGFTNKDLIFLQGVAGGTIGLTAKTLTDLATLQHQVAVRSAEAWNKRASEIPKEVVQGTGLSIAPIKVPALSAAVPTTIFATNPQTGARIQSTDGGNTWKPAGAK